MWQPIAQTSFMMMELSRPCRRLKPMCADTILDVLIELSSNNGLHQEIYTGIGNSVA